MKCTKCDAEIREGAKFCTSCGEPVAANQENAQAGTPVTETETAGDAQEAEEPVAEEKAAEAVQEVETPVAEEKTAENGQEAETPAEEANEVEIAPAAETPVEASESGAADVEEGQAEMPRAAEAEPKAGAEQMAPETGEAIADMEQLAQETGEAAAGAGYAAPETGVPVPDMEQTGSEAGGPAAGMGQPVPEMNGPVPGAPQPGQGAPHYAPGVPQPGATPGTVKEGKKFGKAIIGVIAAVVVVVIAAFAALRLMEKDPKDVVIAAFENVYPKDQVYPTEELFGTSEMMKSLQTTSSEGGMTLKLSDSSEPFITQFAGSGLKMSAQNNLETKETAFNLGLLLNDMEYLNLDAYYGNEKVIMAVPEISSKAFTMDLSKDLAQQFKDSPVFGELIKQQGIDADGLALYIEELKAQTENKEDQPFNLDELLNRYKEGCKAQDNFKAALTVTKGEKQKFTMDGKEVSCKGYNTVISKDSMVDFLEDSSEFFLQDETLRQDFLNQLETTVRLSELMGQSMGESLSAKELRDQTFAEAEKSAKEMIKYLDRTLDDVDMVVYVDKKGRLAALDGTTMLHIEGTDVDVKFHLELKGGSYLTQNMSGTIEMEGDGDVVTLEVQRSGKYDKKNLTDELSLSMDTGDDTFGFSYAAAYTVDDGAYDVSAKLSSNGSRILGLSAEGAVDELEKGKSFHMDIDKLKLTIEDSEYITFKGEYYLRPLEDEIKVPKGDPMDILGADLTEWIEVIQEFQAFSPF
ncbi:MULTISPECIES: zinc ribbon domain-containing protein [Enterocloster]|uniref:Zinc-ribbon domain-containing protein n=2 Tax=Enterocloster lavalensis TaxID=460384 RepID=A0A1I0JV99_9FIRM|nr:MULTISPECIES: zinc ribbon domain-containing protein [Enterocloster]MDR3756946.1 zinc-ribbon domain-containing protein [Enterocloster sp.]SEU14825.1 zinc-ribbon domain-containing protein [Enterocloster lavalensis]